ncbi:MAG TPA: LytR C-terminal domain-containing protein [Microbacteriaceae bacterium]|nr:LytR C-terminal domain-containing protein [Microbacteriaceae bacterium]
MQRFPKDRFDVRPRRGERVGVHRSANRSHRGWITVVVSVAAIAVIVGAGFLVVRSPGGLFGLRGAHDSASQATPVTPHTPASSAPARTSAPASTAPQTTAPTTSTPAVGPTVDPNTRLIVLNGTTVPGAAASATTVLENGGWVGVLRPTNASTQNAQGTVIYYTGAEDKGAALGVAQTLSRSGPLAGRQIPVQESGAFAGNGAAITIVLGLDYAGGVG